MREEPVLSTAFGCPVSDMRRGKHGFKAIHELGQRQAERGADQTQFQDVQTAFPRFVFADEGLGFAKLLGEVYLSHFGLLANGAEQCEEPLLLPGMNAFFHGWVC